MLNSAVSNKKLIFFVLKIKLDTIKASYPTKTAYFYW